MTELPLTLHRAVAIWTLVMAWLVGTALIAGAYAWREWGRVSAQFERDADDLHRVVAQRIDQHDALMTGLSALLAVSRPPPLTAIQAVANNIAQFYPRVSAIDIVNIDMPASVFFTTRSDAALVPAADIAREVQAVQQGAMTVARAAAQYLIVKPVPQPGGPRHVLALQIDARKLVASEFSNTMEVALHAAVSSKPIFGSSRWDATRPARHLRLEVSRTASSQSQPLELSLRRDIALTSLLPNSILLLVGVAIAGALWLVHFVTNERRAVRAAAARAAASAQEARIAHAMRINTMGELSLGIAHELAQPLAALLAQSQAGLRIIKSGRADPAAIEGVLEANARHAKRAGDLLAKLRDWISAEPTSRHESDLDTIIAGIVSLNAREFASAGVDLVYRGSGRTCVALADAIGIEQIAQNLMTNARDACLNATPRGTRVTVDVVEHGRSTGFRVTDDGGGIAADVAAGLFEPFTTTKRDGLGLGLSISRRLVERYGGSITAANRADGVRGSVFTVLMPARAAGEAG